MPDPERAQAGSPGATRRTPETILTTRDLTRRFGGLAAVNGVGIGIEFGRLHAVVGPNGAGKTTLINLLSGDLAASSGNVIYKGEDITRDAADRRSRIGIGRSYQKTNIFPAFTAFENCRLAAQSRTPRRAAPLCGCCVVSSGRRSRAERARRRGPRASCRARRVDAVARRAAPTRNRDGACHAPRNPAARRTPRRHGSRGSVVDGGALAHARAAACDSAGRARHGRRLCRRQVITVMVNGQVLESGTPAQIRASPAVRDAYLGADVGELG